MAQAPDDPWPTMHVPLTPRSGVPPNRSGSSLAFSWLKLPFTNTAPIFAGMLEVSASFTYLNSTFEVPSMVFKQTLPVKPSVMTTSNAPAIRSPPSQLPANSGSFSARRA